MEIQLTINDEDKRYTAYVVNDGDTSGRWRAAQAEEAVEACHIAARRLLKLSENESNTKEQSANFRKLSYRFTILANQDNPLCESTQRRINIQVE